MPGPLWQQVGQLFNTIYLLLDEELNTFTVKFLFVLHFGFSPKARTAYFEPSCILLKKKLTFWKQQWSGEVHMAIMGNLIEN